MQRCRPNEQCVQLLGEVDGLGLASMCDRRTRPVIQGDKQVNNASAVRRRRYDWLAQPLHMEEFTAARVPVSRAVLDLCSNCLGPTRLRHCCVSLLENVEVSAHGEVQQGDGVVQDRSGH